MYNIDLANVKSIVADIVAKHNVENVAFVGCGASKAELYPAKYFLANCSKKLRVAHYTANEFNYDTPDWLGDTTVVITASLGGSTPETVKANSVAKAAGATVVSVTHAAGSALTKEADYTIVHGFEANYAAKLEKMGYVLALAVEILQQVEGFDKYDKMIEGLTNVFEAAENAANSARKSAKEFAEKYKDAPVVYVMSSGASMEVAYSTSICLMMEMQWVNSGSFHSGEFFHGPFEIVDKDVPFILLMNDGKTRPVDARALTFLHRFDALTTVVDAKDYGLGNAGTAASSDELVEIAGIADVLDYTISGHECSAFKPDPEIYLRAMEALGVEPAECLVIEDSPLGIEAGKRSGARVLALRPHEGVNLDQSAADVVIDNLTDILAAL